MKHIVIFLSIVLFPFFAVSKDEKQNNLDLSLNIQRGLVEGLDRKFKIYDKDRGGYNNSKEDEWLKVRRYKNLSKENFVDRSFANRAMNEEIGKSSTYRGIDSNKITGDSSEGIGITGKIKLP